MSTRKVLLVALLCSALSTLVYAQANGSLSGTVADKTGGVLTGASVKVTSQETGLTRDAKTDDSGHFLIPLLPVSVYTIHVWISHHSRQRDRRSCGAVLPASWGHVPPGRE